MARITVIIMLVIAVISPLSIPIGATNILASNENWLAGWTNRIELIIDHNKIDASLTDFPVLIHLSKSSGGGLDDVSFIFDELGSDLSRKKIAITVGDGTTQCYAEIEKWDNFKKQAWLWVKVPIINSDAPTYLYLYYDSAQADNTTYIGDTGSFSSENVWSNGYVMVLHLGEKGNGTPGEFRDSTNYGNNGTGKGGVPDKTSSIIGDGQSFNGTNDYIEISDSDNLSVNTTGHFTISVWISPAVLNFNRATDYIRWMGKGGPGQAEWQFVMYNTDTAAPGGHGTRSQWVSFYVISPAGGDGAGGGGPHSYLGTNDWIFVTGTTDMVRSYGYFNGTKSDYADLWSEYNVQYANGSDPVRIGTQYLSTHDWWNGRIDEVRISDVSRSDAWIKAEYYAQSDNLLEFRVNRPPVLMPVGNKSIIAGELLTFSLFASDPDEDTINFSAFNLPSGASFNPVTRTFSWKPDTSQVGVYYNVIFQASDGILTDTENITITIIPAIQPSMSETPPPVQPVGAFPYYLLSIIPAAILAAAAIILLLRRRTARRH